MNGQTNNQTPNKPSLSPVVIILTIIITAVIVGGCVFLWQSSLVEKINNETANIRMTLQQQINSLQNRITELLSEATSDSEELTDYPKVYFKDTTVGLTLPKEYNIPMSIIPHYYEVQNTVLDLFLVNKDAEVLGHPKQMSLTNYCETNNITTATYSNRCSEGNIQEHKMVTLYEASLDNGGSGLYFFSKIILIETNIPTYPILSLNYQKLPDYTQTNDENIESILESLINASKINLEYSTLVIFNDLDFIINNINFNSPIENSTLPDGVIMYNDCVREGGLFFSVNDCDELTSLGKRYGAEEWLCCK